MSRSVSILAGFIGLALLTVTANAEDVVQLKRELAAKKAAIAELERRVRELERNAGRPGSKNVTREAPAFATAFPARPRSPPPPASAPDEDEMDRALERTLVREGGLVLAAWTHEFTPQLSYAHWDRIQDPVLRNSYSAAASFRMGLPYQTQVSFSLPYVHNEGTTGSSSGFGDVGFLLSKELLQEADELPNLVASVGWTSPTRLGNTFAPVPYVSGFQAGITASKRLDPLVVFMSLSYYSALSRVVAGTSVDPSDVIGARMGASLAVSPTTAVTAGMNVSYLVDPHAGDLVVPNSDRILTSVDVGLSTLIWQRTFFNLTAQFGVTGHVPDFRVVTALPVRF